MDTIIEVRDLLKEFKIYHHRKGFLGSFANLFSRRHTIIRAVDKVSFSIKRGEIVGYIGPNGAGKSTTIKMLTGILVPTSGYVTVNGYVPHQERKKMRNESGLSSASEPICGLIYLCRNLLNYCNISIRFQ